MSTGIPFLQSKEWGEFQTTAGHRTVRFGESLGYEHRLGLGMRYLYCPRLQTSATRLQPFFDECKKQGFIFVRIESIDQISEVRSPIAEVRNRQPQHTLLLDLSQTEEELLASFHPKTRYNIHLAERHTVAVREEKNADIFWKLLQETAMRDKFRGHSKTYYEKMLAMPIAHQLTAYIGDVPIASHILMVYGGTCTYLHGASSNEQRNLMSPYLLQWEGMKLGKHLGCHSYDFWGVAPPGSNPTHPWSGITRFKAGFGGSPVSYPQAVDVVLSPFRYHLYRSIRHLFKMV